MEKLTPAERRALGSKMSKTIDFTQNTWGHAIHGTTFVEKRADKMGKRWTDKRLKRRRYTVLVHSREVPNVGDNIYMTKDGALTVRIDDVERQWNVSDMYKLEIVVTPEKVDA